MAKPMIHGVPTTHPYRYDQPDEHRIDPHENHLPYSWARKDG